MTSVIVLPMRHVPGENHLPPIDSHRLIVHRSPATATICRASGKPYVRHWGDVDIVPSGERGGFEAQSRYESLEIRIPMDALARTAAQVGRAGGELQVRERHMLKHARMVHLAQALEVHRESEDPGHALYVESIGVALAIQLLELDRDRPAVVSRMSDRQLALLNDYIDAHLDQPLTVSRLSREIGASDSRLRGWFKATTGMTVHRYILRKRVERARLLLSGGKLTTSEVALAAGFSHQSHMARWMRRECGITPGRARIPSQSDC